MPHAKHPRKKTQRRARTKPRRPVSIPNLWPGPRVRKRWQQRYARASMPIQIGVGVAVVLTLWLALNWAYQVIRKPSELYFPISGALLKVPAETWREYAPIFRRHATSIMTPDLLAALAQVEGSGNPVVRTYWRWSLDLSPFEIYRPASSAVGMYQITDGTFAEARRYCIHDHVVVEDGPWNSWRSCWFNSLYTRTVPSHAVELTSAYLHRATVQTLARFHVKQATAQQKQDLAALIHLCGSGAGAAYVKRGLRLTPGQRCGDHDARAYIARVNAMRRLFRRMT